MSVESRLADVEEALRLLRDADRLQGRRFSATAPTDADVIGWNATTKKWEPKPMYRMRATRDTAQTMVKDTFDVIEFATEVYDPFNDYDNATNFDYTVPVTGRYLVTAAATITMATAGKLVMLSIFVDGAEAARGIRFEAHSAMFAGVSVTDILELTAAEAVDIRIFHDEAANIDLSADAESNHFAVHILSA